MSRMGKPVCWQSTMSPRLWRWKSLSSPCDHCHTLSSVVLLLLSCSVFPHFSLVLLKVNCWAETVGMRREQKRRKRSREARGKQGLEISFFLTHDPTVWLQGPVIPPYICTSLLVMPLGCLFQWRSRQRMTIVEHKIQWISVLALALVYEANIEQELGMYKCQQNWKLVLVSGCI